MSNFVSTFFFFLVLCYILDHKVNILYLINKSVPKLVSWESTQLNVDTFAGTRPFCEFRLLLLFSLIFMNMLRGSSKSVHAWISIIFCMLNTYVISTTKMTLFYSSKAVRQHGAP